MGGTKLPLCVWRVFRSICAKIRKESGPSESLFKQPDFVFFLFFKTIFRTKIGEKNLYPKMWGKSVRARCVWFCWERKWVDSRNTGWYYHMKKIKILSHNNKHVLQSDPLWFCLSGKTISCLLRDSPQLQHLIYGYRRPRLHQTGQALLSTRDMKPLSSDVLRHVTTLSSWMIHRQENGNGSRSQQRGMLQCGFFLPF